MTCKCAHDGTWTYPDKIPDVCKWYEPHDDQDFCRICEHDKECHDE